jgi:hypothetical protein
MIYPAGGLHKETLRDRSYLRWPAEAHTCLERGPHGT